MLVMLLTLSAGSQLFAKNTLETTQLTGTQDSIIIKFGQDSKIVIYVANAADKEKLKDLDVNELIRRVQYKLRVLDDKADNVTIEEGDMKLKVYRQSNGGRTVITDTTSGKPSKYIGYNNRHGWNWKWNKYSSNKLIDSYLDFDIGFNTYIGDVSNSNLYALSPSGSRYIAFGTGIKLRLDKKVQFKFITGVEFAWNNFMFDNTNVRVLKNDTKTEFLTSAVQQDKSKLVAVYMNVPLMVGYRSYETGLGIAVGGYVGYRLDSYNAYIESGREKQQAHSSFFLNTIRHGVKVAVDFKYLSVFCNYDTSSLFESGKAPNLQAVSFGIKLIGGSL